MGKKVYSEEVIYLQDFKDENGVDIPIKIHPLTIGKQRKALDIFDRAKDDEGAQKTLMDILVELGAFCMKTFEPRLGTKAKIEDHADMQTLVHIVDIATGLNLDPNQMAAAMMQMQQATATAGKS